MKAPSLFLLLSVSLALAACSRPEPPGEPVRAVKLLTVGAEGLSARAELPGEVRARIESRLGFRVGGKLVQRPAQLGQRVAAGELLASLDPSDLALGSQAAQAAVAAAQTQRDLAAADLKRYQELQAQGFVSGAEIDRRQATLRAAEATLKQAQAQSAVQGNQAAYARLLADAPGVVVGVEAEVGQVVSTGATVVRVARDGARDVVISVPEDRVTLLRPGQPAQVRLWAAGEQAAPVPGTVREVAASAEAVTRTYQVKVALPDSVSPPLGATAVVTLSWGQEKMPPVIKLPGAAVMASNQGDRQGSMVWVFDPASSTVQPRPVKVASVDGNSMVIAEGLKPGEEVVAAGGHVLTPGQKVTRFQASDK